MSLKPFSATALTSSEEIQTLGDIRITAREYAFGDDPQDQCVTLERNIMYKDHF